MTARGAAARAVGRVKASRGKVEMERRRRESTGSTGHVYVSLTVHWSTD
jgi:hypothetical protein